MFQVAKNKRNKLNLSRFLRTHCVFDQRIQGLLITVCLLQRIEQNKDKNACITLSITLPYVLC